MKGIDNVSLFKIAHSKTRNFRKAYKVSYAVQLGIFLKEVYKLKKLIEERVVKACESSNFNLMGFTVDRVQCGKPVITIKYKINGKVFRKIICEFIVKRIKHIKDIDDKVKVVLKEIYETIYSLLETVKDKVEEKINFDEYVPVEKCTQMSLF